jgi:hypothetical protein
VEFRRRVDEADGFRRLVCGIKGVAPHSKTEKEAAESSTRVRVAITLDCDPADFQEVMASAEALLRTLSGDAELRVKFVRHGSTLVVIECSTAAAARLQDIVAQGLIEEIAGIKVRKVSRFEESSPEIGLTELGATLASLSRVSPLPSLLPVVHTIDAREFARVVGDGRLQPRFSKVFGSPALHFFYGGVFYRKPHVRLPVVLVFEPPVLDIMECYYPFDTGYIDFLGLWKDRPQDFQRVFRVEATSRAVPAALVQSLFGTNRNYLAGRVDPGSRLLPAPFPELYELLAADRTAHGVDQRLRLIEALASRPVGLQHLTWVGYPETHRDTFYELVKLLHPAVPTGFAYKAHSVQPTELADVLQQDVRERILSRFPER